MSAKITITQSNDFKTGSQTVAFDYMLLKTATESMVGEKVEIASISLIEKLDDCGVAGLICFVVELDDGRSFQANAKPQVYAKLSIGSDPIQRLQNPAINAASTDIGLVERVKKKAAEVVGVSCCGS